jgi:molybdopterin-guanine dinucleotide biosynthesis protein A
MRSAVLLTGGKSSRMGTEKALVQFRGKPLVRWPLEILVEVADELVVSVSPSPSEELLHVLGKDVTVVRDTRGGMGPIEGLLSAFRRVGGEYVAIAPCDSPFIETGLYDVLFSEAEGHDGAVPLVNGYYEPLIAVYRREAFLGALERTVGEGRSKPIDAYRYMDLVFVTEKEIMRNGVSLDSFININLSHDLDAANKKL